MSDDAIVAAAAKWGSSWPLGRKRPWIHTDDYEGPCRRYEEGSPPEFGERRVRTLSPDEISPDDFPGQDVFK